jgi:hypothetical protein
LTHIADAALAWHLTCTSVTLDPDICVSERCDGSASVAVSLNAVPSLAELRLLLAGPNDRYAEAYASDEVARVGVPFTDVIAPLVGAAHQLAGWMALHDPCGPLVLTVTWDERLIMVEVRDSGSAVPRPESVRADVELAARLLTPLATEWGTDNRDDGRCLWVACATARHPIAAGRS